MTDLQLLLVLLAMLYLSECCLWVRRGSVVFRSLSLGGHSTIFPSRIAGNDGGGLVFLNPLPPFGSVFVCRSWTISITEEAIYSYVAQCLDPAGRPRRLEQLYRFEEIRGIWAKGRDVLVNGKQLRPMGNDHDAKDLASFLAAVWRAAPGERNSLIDMELDQRLDVLTLAERLKSWRQHSRLLRIWSWTLFLLLFIALPFSLWVPLVEQFRGAILIGAVICVAGCAATFYRAHRHLFPGGPVDRWRSLTIMVFTPTASMRAQDAITRDLLSDFDPLAIAVVLCKPTDFRAFARRMLQDLREPLRPVCPTNEPICLRTEQQSRQRYCDRLERFVAQSGYDLRELLSPPTAGADSESRSFCPRCWTQFATPRGCCDDCGGVPLHPIQATLDGAPYEAV